MRIYRLAALAFPFLAVASAQAADLPNRGYAPAPAAAYYTPPVFSWTGFYVGLNGGYGWGSLGNVGNTTFGKPSGFTLGGTLGYNYQINQFVVGLEGDLNWTNIDSTGRTLVGGPPASAVVSTAGVNWMGTLRARVGLSLDRALIFATGGYAGASLDTKFNDITLAIAGKDSGWRNGWAVGGGIEYAFSNNISAKTEYLYTSFGAKDVFAATPYASRGDLSVSLVRAGVNYRF
ncbi:MAG: porin family protein [Beijerinckiaceae bacterium]|nr:porin family protein [Beijerinckiaceae bacterium]